MGFNSDDEVDHEEDALSNASPGELINASAHCVATPESASSEAEEACELNQLNIFKWQGPSDHYIRILSPQPFAMQQRVSSIFN